MADIRFAEIGQDDRFPEVGVDSRFPSPGVDTRFNQAGQDGRFTDFVLTRLLKPTLTYLGSGNWSITPGLYAGQNVYPVTLSWSLVRNDVDLGAIGLTFTDATTDATFYVVEKASAPQAGFPDAFISTGGVYVPATAPETSLGVNDWLFSEAIPDVDTRRSYAETYVNPASGKEFAVYRGASSAGNLTQLATMTLSGSKYSWTSVGLTTENTVAYGRIAERNIGDVSNASAKWVSAAKSFVASSKPLAVGGATAVTGAGAQEIDLTIAAIPDGQRRAIQKFQYSTDGSTWVDMIGGATTGKRTLSSQGYAQLSYQMRAVNANGVGPATVIGLATPGAAATAPASYTSAMATLADSPSAAGDKLTLTVLSHPPDGGSASTDTVYRVNNGAPISIGTALGARTITVVAVTPALVEIRDINAQGAGPWYTVDTKTPTKVAAASTTAYFGADTVALAGGWKPENAAGDEIDIVGIVSQAGMTRTWSVVDGALVANGTPDVDNGKTLTLATATSNLVVAISTLANSQSARTYAEMKAALVPALYSVPATVYLRPITVTDLKEGGVLPKGPFNDLNYLNNTRRRTLHGKHPNQKNRALFKDVYAFFENAQCMTFDNVDWLKTIVGSASTSFLENNNSPKCIGLTFQNCDIGATTIPDAALHDPVLWPTGYVGAYNQCVSLVDAVDLQFFNVRFHDCYAAGDFGTKGAFRLVDCKLENFYFDGFRFYAADDLVPKIVKNIEIDGCFSIKNENGSVIHADPMQWLNRTGLFRNFLVMNVIVNARDYRTNVMSAFRGTHQFNRCIVHNFISQQVGDICGMEMGKAQYVVMSHWTGARRGFAASSFIRLGLKSGCQGEIVVQNCAVHNTTGSTIQVLNPSVDADPGYLTKINCKDDNNTNLLDVFVGPSRSQTCAATKLAVAAKPGGPLDTGVSGLGGVYRPNAGAVDTAGNWRTLEHPPMHGDPPVLVNSGADLIITPQTPYLAALTPGSWDYQYRQATDAVWVKVNGLTGPSATLVAPNKTALQVMTRWRGQNGLIGTWSLAQAAISSATPLNNTSAPTLSRTGATVTVTAGTYSAAPDSYTRIVTINGTTTSLAGTTFTVAPGDSYYVTETAVKAGYISSPVTSATGTYPVIATTTAPVLSVSGTTANYTPGAYSPALDSLTVTKTVNGVTTGHSGSTFSVPAGQSAYVTETPVKAGYYGVPVQSNTVTSMTQIGNTAVGTLARAGNTITLTPATWNQAGVAVARSVTIDGSTTTLSSTMFTLNPGSTATVTETATKAGFADSAPVTTASITNPVVGTVLTEKWTGYAVGNTFIEMDVLYGRSSSNVDGSFSTDTAAPGGIRNNLNLVTLNNHYFSRDDTVTALAGAWTKFQIRALIRLPNTASASNNTRAGIGWGAGTTMTGLQFRRGTATNSNDVLLLLLEDNNTTTLGTSLMTGVAG